MPPRVKITKNDIIKTAVELVRTDGENSINARSIASVLNCSTQPIFSNFATMQQLKEAVIADAYCRYLGFLKNEAESGKYHQYKSYGMAYIRFAKEEKELFKLLFMRNRQGEDISPTADFDASIELIMNANAVTKEKATLMHMEMWACVHGIASMLATSFLSLEWELISDMLTDVYKGIQSGLLKENKL